MNQADVIKKLQRRLERAQAQLEQCEAKYNGKEREHTFHGGQELGYAQARVSVLEDWLDHVNDAAESLGCQIH